MKHTELPWEDIGGFGHVYKKCGEVCPSKVIEERQEGESWLDMRLRTNTERLRYDQELRDNRLFTLKAVNNHYQLIEALEKIVNGDGYYGAQAFEYKQIAQQALRNVKGEE